MYEGINNLVKSWHDELDIHHAENATVSGDCCRWDGVKCNEETGHVIGLDLSSSCLYGTFPCNSTLFSLNHLRELDLSKNNFNYSKIPSDIGRLPSSQISTSPSSFLSGQIPSEISKLSSLSFHYLSINEDPTGVNEKLNLKLNDLSLERLVNNLSRLTHLYLDMVDISSEVPLSLSNRTSLKAISLGFCDLLGEFPTSLLLPKLKEISLIYNPELGGYLHEFHSNSPLCILDLCGTKFCGELPSSIGNLTDLIVLGLAHNYFSELPQSIMNLTHLNRLYLSNMVDVGNAGILKSWLSKLNLLTDLMLSKMNLGIEIMPTLSNFTRLHFLSLQNNLLTEPLPSWLMNLTQLGALDLLGNQFQGPIPPWISYLINLHTLTLSFNGTVDKFDPFFMLPKLRYLKLTGVSLTFPQNICTNSSLLKLHILSLESCNLTEFPKFLRCQDELRELYLPGTSLGISHNGFSFAGNLALCGAPLFEKCKKDIVPPSPPQQLTNDEMTEEDIELIDWIIISLGCVSGFIIGYVLGKIYVADRHHDWFMETFGRRRRSETRMRRSTQRHRRN
ncbi:receptor like protein 30-like [Chenopodium quinoa]|uniref:receptor like protein 30-like n=1 Tax=Chenopodium quinoa TaxID=63459 RepID=UPI000B790F1D|nr:receptor like protein 30-like [Chenopodium quinoa]